MAQDQGDGEEVDEALEEVALTQSSRKTLRAALRPRHFIRQSLGGARGEVAKEQIDFHHASSNKESATEVGNGEGQTWGTPVPSPWESLHPGGGLEATLWNRRWGPP